jgi:hypothetical protein
MIISSTSSGPKIDQRERAHHVSFTAETIAEEYVLACLYRQMNSDRYRLDMPVKWDEVDMTTETGVPAELLERDEE